MDLDDSLTDELEAGTLSEDRAKTVFLIRKHHFALDFSLPRDVRDRGLKIFDQALEDGIFNATKETPPFVTFVRDTLMAIGQLYMENQTQPPQPDTSKTNTSAKGMEPMSESSTAKASSSDHALLLNPMSEPPTPKALGKEHAAPLELDESTDEGEDLAESESDFEPPVVKRKVYIKRDIGRPRTVASNRVRVAAAVAVRRMRKRRVYWNPELSGRDPKRHLYGPPEDLHKLKELTFASPSTASISRVPDQGEEVDFPNVSVVVSRRNHRSGKADKQQMHRTPSKQLVSEKTSDNHAANPANTKSLIVKLKMQSSCLARLATPSPIRHSAAKPDHARKRVHFADTDTAQNNSRVFKKLKLSIKPPKNRDSAIQHGVLNKATSTPEKTRTQTQVSPKLLSNQGTPVKYSPLARRGAICFKSSPLKYSQSASPPPPSHQDTTTTTTDSPRQRRGALSLIVKLPALPLPAPTALCLSSEPDKNKDNNYKDKDGELVLVSPSPSPPSLIVKLPALRLPTLAAFPSSTSELGNDSNAENGNKDTDNSDTDTDSDIVLPSSPPPPPSHPPTTTNSPPTTLTFTPFPPDLTHRALTPFHRGANIALENILADHAISPTDTLLELVEDLDSDRPIVKDWEHVTVLKGGCWVYEILRGVWEDKGTCVDVEVVVGKLEKWVESEMERLGGVIDV
jgi:hypothetical protein